MFWTMFLAVTAAISLFCFSQALFHFFFFVWTENENTKRQAEADATYKAWLQAEPARKEQAAKQAAQQATLYAPRVSSDMTPVIRRNTVTPPAA